MAIPGAVLRSPALPRHPAGRPDRVWTFRGLSGRDAGVDLLRRRDDECALIVRPPLIQVLRCRRRAPDEWHGMTASVALGIAVDDTLHFLTFFQRGLETLPSRVGPSNSPARHCGSAMIQTSLTCGLGLMVFAGSRFFRSEGQHHTWTGRGSLHELLQDEEHGG